MGLFNIINFGYFTFLFNLIASPKPCRQVGCQLKYTQTCTRVCATAHTHSCDRATEYLYIYRIYI